MKTSKNLIALLLVTTMASGCAKFRELTRRDYAMLRDPFAGSKEDEENAEPPVDAARSTSGYVKIEDTQSEADKTVKADYSTVAKSKTVSSGFPGIRVRGMGDAISTEIGSNAESPESAPAEFAALERTIEEQTKSAASVTQTAPPADSGFTEWASSESERWKTASNAAIEKAEPYLQPIKQVSKTVEHPSTTKAETASPFILKRQNKPQPPNSPAATPPPVAKRELLKLKKKTRATSKTPPPPMEGNPFAELEVKPAATAKPTIKTPVPAPDFDDFKPDNSGEAKNIARKTTDNPNPDSNPFADFDRAAENSKTGTSKPLDEAFNFDTGWRPVDVETP